MQILELRKGSAEEAELLEAAVEAHGDWILAAAPLMTRLWLMGSDWAPGLRFVGGLAVAPDLASTSGLPPLSVGGGGLRLEDAFAGCLAEALERTAQIERTGDIVLSAPPGAVRVPDQIGALIDLLIARDPAAAGRRIDWIRARSAVSGTEILMPADWCLRRQQPATLTIPGAAASTGCAAAATVGEAETRALLELIERDAAALWWLAGRPAAALSPDSIEAAAAARFEAELRQASGSARATRVLDISGDLPVPVMAAIAHDADGTGLVIGLAARLSPARAAASALVELCQMELGLKLAAGKREQLGSAALAEADRRHLERAAASVALLAPLATTSAPRRHTSTSALAAALAQVGAEAWHVDLTRPTSSRKVVKAIAPALQPMPGDIVTPRLSIVQRAHGDLPPPPVTIM